MKQDFAVRVLISFLYKYYVLYQYIDDSESFSVETQDLCCKFWRDNVKSSIFYQYIVTVKIYHL